MPTYAKAIMRRYEGEMQPLRDAAAARAAGSPPAAGRRTAVAVNDGKSASARGPLDEAVAWLALCGLLI